MKMLQILPAAILWAVVLIRVIGLRLGWKPGILAAMVLVAMGTTLNIDAVYLVVDSWVGDRNFMNLVVHVFLGLGMTELSRLIVSATDASRLFWRLLVAAGIALIVVQAVLLLSAETPHSATNFTDAFAGIPEIAWYQGLFFAWIGLITMYTGVECVRRDRTGEKPLFRVGFDIIATSCFIGVLAVVLKLVLICQELAGVDSSLEQVAYVCYRTLIASTLLGFAAGFGLPAYSRGRQQMADRGQRRELLVKLAPIVAKLSETEPGRQAGKAAALNLGSRSSRERLYRWIIFVDDIRMDHPGLLSATERKLLDDIEASFAERDPIKALARTGS